MTKYYIKLNGATDWLKVSERKFAITERSEGFRPKLECELIATSGFRGPNITGKVVECICLKCGSKDCVIAVTKDSSEVDGLACNACDNEEKE